jgi:hypothetical protein
MVMGAVHLPVIKVMIIQSQLLEETAAPQMIPHLKMIGQEKKMISPALDVAMKRKIMKIIAAHVKMKYQTPVHNVVGMITESMEVFVMIAANRNINE